MAKQIAQEIITGADLDSGNIKITNNIQLFSIQALPGCVVTIDNSSITLGPAGLLNVNIPVNSIVIPQEPNRNLLLGSNTQMVIDYIYESTSGGEQN